MIVALFCAEPARSTSRSLEERHRKLGSSWNPTHIRWAANVVGAATPARMDRAMTRRTMRLTSDLPRKAADGWAEKLRAP